MSIQLDNGKLPRRVDSITGERRYLRAMHEHRRTLVLELLCAGNCQKRIAIKLGINQGDVSYCINIIMRRAGVKTHAQLGVWAAKQGLV